MPGSVNWDGLGKEISTGDIGNAVGREELGELGWSACPCPVADSFQEEGGAGLWSSSVLGLPPSVGADLAFVSLLLPPSACRTLLGWPRAEPSQLVPLGLHSSFVTSNTIPRAPSQGHPCQPCVPAVPPWEGTAAFSGHPCQPGHCPRAWGCVPSLPAPPAAAKGLGTGSAVCSWESGGISSPLSLSCVHKPSAWPRH